MFYGSTGFASRTRAAFATHPNMGLDWVEALVWLLKEFRLRIGAEPSDDAAVVQFWVNGFRAPKQLQPTDWEGRRKKPGGKENVAFRTAWEENGHVAQSTPEERRLASFWDKASLVKRLEAFFFLKRTHCPALPVVADSALHVSLRSGTPRATPTKQVKPPRSYRDFAPTPPPVKKVPQAITIGCTALQIGRGESPTTLLTFHRTLRWCGRRRG